MIYGIPVRHGVGAGAAGKFFHRRRCRRRHRHPGWTPSPNLIISQYEYNLIIQFTRVGSITYSNHTIQYNDVILSYSYTTKNPCINTSISTSTLIRLSPHSYDCVCIIFFLSVRRMTSGGLKQVLHCKSLSDDVRRMSSDTHLQKGKKTMHTQSRMSVEVH